MRLEVSHLSHMTQSRRSTLRVSIIGGDNVNRSRSVLCKVSGEVDFVLINGRRTDEETVETDDGSVATFAIDPRGHGRLIVAFSLVSEDEADSCPSLECSYDVREEPEHRRPIPTPAPSRHSFH